MMDTILIILAALGLLALINWSYDLYKWWKARNQPIDTASLDWPEVEKPKNTEYHLTEDGELDGDFPVDNYGLTYDKSKVDEYARAQPTGRWVTPLPHEMDAFLRERGSGWCEPYRDGTLTYLSAYNSACWIPTPPDPPLQEPGYTIVEM